jgi:hypothetical protein
MHRNLIAVCLAAAGVLFAGCNVPTDPADNTTPGGNDNQTIVPAALSITLENKTDQAVDPNFYRSGSNLDAATLFANSANRYANFNGKTTLAAHATVNLSLALDQVQTIGSNQAAFGDLTSWEGGKSSEQPVLHLGTEFGPAQKVTFTFDRDSAKKYHTTWSVQN